MKSLLREAMNKVIWREEDFSSKSLLGEHKRPVLIGNPPTAYSPNRYESAVSQLAYERFLLKTSRMERASVAELSSARTAGSFRNLAMAARVLRWV